MSLHLADMFDTFASSRVDRPTIDPNTSSLKRTATRKGRKLAVKEEVDGDEEQKDTTASDMVEDFIGGLSVAVRAELYVRFSACIDALRWCGFIRPAAGKRGSDEMLKLIYNTT